MLSLPKGGTTEESRAVGLILHTPKIPRCARNDMLGCFAFWGNDSRGCGYACWVFYI